MTQGKKINDLMRYLLNGPQLTLVHPHTGLTAIGLRRDGRPVWPVMGGDGTAGDPPADPNPPPVVPPTPPPAPSADPKPFDPKDLSPEVQAYLRQRESEIAAREGGKSREQARENARREALAELAKAWGKPDEPVDPAAAAAELAAARAENRALKVNGAVGDVARSAGADPRLTVALLSMDGKLTDLDPAADGFADKVKALVEGAVKDNPRLKLDAGPTPGAQAPVNGGFNGQPTNGQRPSLQGSIAEYYAKQ